MKYILNEPWCLRGWKNKPFCLCDFTSPAEPLEVSEADKDFLSSPFEYDGGNQTIDRMIDAGMLRAACGKTGDLLGYDPQMCYFFEHGFPEKFREAIQRGEKKRIENMSLLEKLMSWR